MKVVYTRRALRDLDDILDHMKAAFPAALEPFKRRLRLIEARIGRWPESAPRVAERPDVRIVAVARYPYRVFYQVTAETVQILHTRHSARRDP